MRKHTGNDNLQEVMRVTLGEAAALLPGPQGERSRPMFEHGSMLVKLYAPRGSDPQQPHTRDEIYVVARGTGWFVNGDRLTASRRTTYCSFPRVQRTASSSSPTTCWYGCSFTVRKVESRTLKR